MPLPPLATPLCAINAGVIYETSEDIATGKLQIRRVRKLTVSLKDDATDNGSIIINLNWTAEHVCFIVYGMCVYISGLFSYSNKLIAKTAKICFNLMT